MVNETFWIEKLELKDFQKHKHLVINFTNGVNVIVGETGTGKSCVMRAIDWLFFPFELKGDVVRKENSKKTSVKVWLSNGSIIERLKSDSVNRYIIGEGEDKQEYNAVGKVLPKEVKEALLVNYIDIDGERLILNISNQIALPFLLDKSGSFRMKLFNLMTGNHITDKVMQDYNKNSLRLNRQQKTEEELIEEYNKNLIEAEMIVAEKQIKKIEFKKQYDKIKTKEEIYDNLVEINTEQKKKKKEIQETELKLKKYENRLAWEIVEYLKKTINKYTILKEYQLKLSYVYQGIGDTKEGLGDIKIPKIDTRDLKDKCDVLNKIEDLKIKLEIKRLATECETEKMKEINKEVKESEQKLKDLKDKLGICPFCKRKY